MEGAGSRLGRTSSRYGQSSTTFNGPVRRWQKKWVLVSSSSPSLTRSKKSHSSKGTIHSTSNGGPDTGGLLLCKWTPLPPHSAASADGDNTSSDLETPPRRKFRYTPISVFEERRGLVKKDTDEAKSADSNQSTEDPAMEKNDSYGMLNSNHAAIGDRQVVVEENLFKPQPLTEPECLSKSQLNLGVYLKGCGDNNAQLKKEKGDGQFGEINQRGFWPTG